LSQACNAAEIKVIASPGVRGAVLELARGFETDTGHKVVANFDVFAVLVRRIDAGEPFDIAILTPELIDDLILRRKIAPETRSAFGRTGLGFGVRKGAPLPDIGSVEALKRVLLAANSVAHSKEGTSGAQFLSLLDRLGLAEEMKSKLKALDTKGLAQAIAAGEADLVATGTGPILIMPETELLGAMPSDLQTYIVFAAGVSMAARHPDAANMLMQFMNTQTATAIKKAKGVEPA
jgi:molybdate transport system substrate-binding protein